jgi:hypothetical protein
MAAIRGSGASGYRPPSQRFDHASTHAAGVVVAPEALEEFCPVYKDQKSESITTQFAMKFVEKIGLVKFDFLGLKNLTVIDNAVKLIRAGKNPDFDISKLRDDDEATYQLLQSGNTTGVFQLESSGMKELLVKLKPSCFEDIIAVALSSRSSRVSMVDDFIDRAWPEVGNLRTSPVAADFEGHLWSYRLPGAGNADCPFAGRVFPGRRRPAAPGHG